MQESTAYGPARIQKVAAARFSIYSNTTLTLLKLIVGLLTGSISVLSEAVHSASDLLASWIAFFSVRVSDRPADEEHPYGHGKVESLSGMAEALLIFGAAVYIIYESVEKLRHPPAHLKVDLGILVMVVSVVLNSFVARYLFRVARQTDSLALEADAEHLRTDVYTSLGVTLGLVLVYFTGVKWLDPAAAIAVAVLIMHAAFRLTREAVGPLMDARLPAEEMDTVRAIFDSDARVLGYHKLRARKSGSFRIVDAHIMVDDDMAFREAHDLTEELEDRIRAELPNTEITLHTEPFNAELRHQHEHHGGPCPEDEDRRE